VSNALRRDLLYERGGDRFGRGGAQSRYTRSPIPANERTQQRWNSNPFEVVGGGSAMSESDPGAWLLPYWVRCNPTHHSRAHLDRTCVPAPQMARYHGLIDSSA
jgi:hypothetical protein